MKKPSGAPRIAIVYFPWVSKAPYKFLSDLVAILEPLASQIILVGGNTRRIGRLGTKVIVRDINVEMHNVKSVKPKILSMLSWIGKCILVQLKHSIELLRLRHDVDQVIFYIAYPYYLLPLCVSKFLRKRSVEILTRSRPRNPTSVMKIAALQDRLLFGLLDGISPESGSLVADLNLEKHGEKILQCGARFVDTHRYVPRMNIGERTNTIGFVSRLRIEKGITAFVNAIPLISRNHPDTDFIIVGEGDLANWTRAQTNKISSVTRVRIEVTGWVPEEDFPHFLNRIKLLILPTQHFEGLPTIILEAMACGTLVLAPRVGAIPDVVRDEVTGFILSEISPDAIAGEVSRALNHPDIEGISTTARKMIESHFTYDAAVRRYREIVNPSCRWKNKMGSSFYEFS